MGLVRYGRDVRQLRKIVSLGRGTGFRHYRPAPLCTIPRRRSFVIYARPSYIFPTITRINCEVPRVSGFQEFRIVVGTVVRQGSWWAISNHYIGVFDQQVDAEEVAYSTFAFYDSDLTYLFYPGLCDTERFVAGPGHGVFGFERGNKQLLDVSWTANESTNSAFRSSINTMLHQHEKGWRPKPTFSSRTVEYPVELRNGAWDGFIWYNIKYAVDFLTDHTKISGHGRR